MHTVLNVFLIILTIVVVLLAVLYFVGRRLQKKQAVQQEQMEAAKQTVIDKKKLKMKEAGLPQMVLDSTPKIMRRTKLPIVKAKVGPRIMTFIADAKVFEMIPVKKEVKATISGLYITDVKGVRGTVLEPPKAKEGFFKRMKNKVTGKDKKAETASESKASAPAAKQTASKAPAPQKQAAAKNTGNASNVKKSGSKKKKKK